MTMGEEVKNPVLDNRDLLVMCDFRSTRLLLVLSEVGTCPMVDIPLVDLFSRAAPYFVRTLSIISVFPSPKHQTSH